MKTQTDNLFKFDKWIKHEHPVGPHKFDYWYNIANCWCFGEKIFKIYPQFDGTDIGLEKEEDWIKRPDLFILTISDFRMSAEDAGNEKPVRAFGTFEEAVGRAGELVGEMMAAVREIGAMKSDKPEQTGEFLRLLQYIEWHGDSNGDGARDSQTGECHDWREELRTDSIMREHRP